MKKQVFSTALALCLCISTVPKVYAYQQPPPTQEQVQSLAAEPNSRAAATTNPTEKQAYDSMIALKNVKEYEEGTAWTNSTPYTMSNSYNWKGAGSGSNVGVRGGVGCAAFAFILSDAAFGSLPARMKTSGFTFEDVHVGDILRTNNNAHTVIVLQKNSVGVVLAEGNYSGKVHWGRTMTKAEVQNADTWITRYVNGTPTEDGTSPDDPMDENAKGDIAGGLHWKLSKSNTLAISGTGEIPDYNDGTQPWNAYLDQILNIVIENGVTRIGNNAFANSKTMSVTIPDSVTEIGDTAFHACMSLNAITLPASIQKVGASAFASSGLTYAIFDPNNKNTVMLGRELFFGCRYLSSISLPPSLDRIRDGTFQSCTSLSSLYIPKSIQGFGENDSTPGSNIFASCATLRDIYFGGTQNEWNSLKTNYLGITTNPTIHYNAAPPNHLNSEDDVIKDPDNPGEDPGDTHTHSYGEPTVTKAPTCTDAGEQTSTCSGCGDVKTETIPALGHDYADPVTTKAPTCTESGEQTSTCSRCSDIKTEPIPATGHKFIENTDGDYECANERDASGNSATIVIPIVAEGYNKVTIEKDQRADYAYQNEDSAKQYMSGIVRDTLASVSNLLSYTLNTISYQSPTKTTDGLYTYTVTLNFNARTAATTLTTEPLYLIIPALGSDQHETYNISISNMAGGEVSSNASTAAEGTSVSLSVRPNTGYKLSGLTVSNSQGQNIPVQDLGNNRYSFTMPAANVTIKAVFETTGGSSSSGSSGGGGGSKHTQSTSYPPTINQPSEGGRVTISPASPKRGDTVTIKPAPENGYAVDKITVTDQNKKLVDVKENSDGTFSFTQPNNKVEIEVTYKTTEETSQTTETSWTNSFADVSENDWYYEAVQFVNARGLMNGYNNGQFAPNDNLSRAQLAQILFNKEEKPLVNDQMDFSDVADKAWYAEAIRWASSRGIASGYGNGLFGPNDFITREQLAVMLWRYADNPTATNKQLHFSDAGEVSSYALDALYWAVENGIINGKSTSTLDPQGLATRAQAAQILKNYLER